MMKTNFKYMFFLFTLLGVVGFGPFYYYANTEPQGSREWVDSEAKIISEQADNFDSTVLKKGLIAYLKARHEGLDSKQILTLIDYDKPSTEKRLLVVDLKTNKVLFNTYVSHGKNSGSVTPTSFSNQPGSLKSSVGVFITTGDPYVGSNGYSLRLIGLEPGINDNAYRRSIVVHGAWYVSPETIQRYGALGRSWGCPAVSDRLARPLINTIKEHTLVFVYSDYDRWWLHNSSFLPG